MNRNMHVNLKSTLIVVNSPSPPTLSMEDFQRDEGIDCKVISNFCGKIVHELFRWKILQVSIH